MKMAIIILLVVSVVGLSNCFEFNRDLNRDLSDDDDDIPKIFNYNQYLKSPYSTKVDSKSKVETLGKVLKGHINDLKSKSNKEIELVFLVDSSTSVGKNNFLEEIKFVKKLLSDFTVDVNHTRVSVITFSSRERVTRHVDYLADDHKDRHKCSLLSEDLKKIEYSGGGTYTLGAFLEAKKVLKNARATANKAIFLVTDGFSNGGDPRPEAKNLQKQGIKIFTFGIQNGNVRELYDMASHPKNESTYILDSFEEFEALAKRALHEDLSSGLYIEQRLRKCNRLCVGRNCCDKVATCNCGSHTGTYECMCPAGFYGNGLTGGCQACPSGTYKADRIPGDIFTCNRCPDKNHMTEPGATSVEQCVCRKGYRNFKTKGCAVLKCPTLVVPKSGYFVNDKCKNVFNAACGLRCKPGYELRGSSLRICREDGTWSGTGTECIMKTCPALMIPKNGNMICTTDDFSFNTVCRFTCDTGYKLVGSRKRTCLAIAYWTGINTRCREITCRPLSIVRDGSIYPPACTAGDVAFGTTCSVTCHPGYSLNGPHSKQCLPEGVWTPASEVSQCIDTSPPFIMCPYNVEAETDLNENTATVSWQVPLAVDNSGYVPILSSAPAVMPPEKFPIGTTKVTYIAEDLNKNSADCHFYILVKDKQVPTIDRCFSPLPIVSPEPYAEVSWEEPIFSDNSGMDVRIRRSHAPGLFPKGKTAVVYTAYDTSGNNRTCVLKINVIPHPCEYPPEPLNGNRTCHEGTDNVVCIFTCKAGYHFAIQPAREYSCSFDNVWEPRAQTPISDCTALQQSHDVIQPASFTFAGLVACQQRIELTRLKKDFEHRITKRVNELCEEGVDCSIRELETTCEQQDDSGVRIVLGRDKRSIMDTTKQGQVRRKRESQTDLDKQAIIKFNFIIAGTASGVGDSAAQIADQQHMLKVVDNIKNSLKKDVKRGDFNLNVNGKPLQLKDVQFDDSPIFECDQGSIVVDNYCAKCPVGTFFNVVSEQCEACPIGTFQPSLGQLSCLYCPANSSTPGLHATSEVNCKSLCLPGTVSYNGLEMCETCRRSYYQNEYGQTDCKKCQKRHTTLKRGSRTDRKCREKCAAGYVSRSGLRPCWPCPRGTYQPRDGKSSCIKCPPNADTAHTASTEVSQCEYVQADGPQNIQAFPMNDGQQYEEIVFDECFAEPCFNGATCKSEQAGVECTCAPGYNGVYCQFDIDECSGNPCLNGGSCEDRKAGYMCTCLTGFEGDKCEVDTDDCSGQPCENGGTCIDSVDAFSCRCPNGFEGSTCEINVDECESQPCLNGGTCDDKVASYGCICPTGIKGDQCEINTDDCASGPCLNNAACVDGVGTYICDCIDGYTGSRCETNIDDCANTPCAAGATCEDLENGYKCHCLSGTNGPDCTSDIDIYFQLDFPSTASTTDYARVTMTQDLSSATVCFWMKTDDTQNQGTPFSYATEDGDNIFTLTDYDGFVFSVNGEKVTTTIKANTGSWHHVCVLWSSNRGSWKIYRDGVPMDSGRSLANGQIVKGGGEFVIGQEQDSLGGGFASPESFIGHLTQLNVWSRELSLADIEALRQSCEKHTGDVISWADISGNVHGAVSDSPVDFCRDCLEPVSIDNGEVTHDAIIAGSVAQYSCQRGFRLAGRRDRLCLVTGEWEGKVPTCARVQCGYPGQLSNGWIEGERYTFDNRIRYFCERGHKLVGSTTRYCGEYGFWEGDAPTCEEIMCTIPLLSTNTLVVNPSQDSKYSPGEEAFFKCTAGNNFYTEHTSVYCQRDGTWEISIPTCDPQTCQEPPRIDHGHFPNTNNLNEFPVAHVAQYTCQFGYMFSLNSINPAGSINCLPSGQWEANLPECFIVSCREPGAIAHGQFTSSVEYIFLAQVRYSCNTGYELTHTDVLECYETGEWSKRAPECIPLRCGRPNDILHGYFEGDIYTYKETVTYLCNLGYILVGIGRIECLESRTWSGDLPACKPVSCGKPDSIDHGSVKGRDYTLNNVIRYVCDIGYALLGSEERVCRETGKWQNDSPSCSRVECAIPATVNNGFYVETSFLFSDTVNYICENGFYLEGESTLTCMANKQWSSIPPECLSIECFSPPNIHHARYANPLSLESFIIGSRIRYQCDVGYEISLNSLNPSGEIECLETGQWEANLPECFIVTCVSPLPIQNGNVVVSSIDLEFGSSIRYICNEGYDIEGNANLNCESGGIWSDEAPICNAIECLAPPFVLNGRVDFKDLKLGSVIRYMCNDGYENSGLEVRRCLANLTWEGHDPSCEPVNCGMPESLSHGSSNYQDTQFQATVVYRCDIGYILIGDDTHVCIKDKVWNGNMPVCEIIQCDQPSHIISNGRMSGDNYTYGSVVTYVCDPGYYIDGETNTRTCLASGDWDRPIIVCTSVECPRLNVRNGFTSGFQTGYDTTLLITCRPGYRLEGGTERTCQEDGTWSGEASVCVKFKCPRLRSPQNGQVLVLRGRATYLCLEGYTLNGASVRECGSTDNWSLDAPTCDAVPCPDITTSGLSNGIMTYDLLTYGSTIIFECNPGYLLMGERTLECQSNSLWSGNVPFCNKKTCFPPFVPSHSRLIGHDLTFGATIEYQCDEGYIIGGTTTRICQADSSWSGSSPNCEFIICPRPEPNRNVIVRGTSYSYGTDLEYLCNDGYVLNGPSLRTCTETGEWSGKEPTCVRNECPRPTRLENGRVHASALGQGSKVNYECNEGYELNGFSFRLCLSSLEWGGTDPRCEKVQCPNPTPLNNGFYNGNEFYFQDVVEYRCNSGYDLVGGARRLCLSVGLWSGADATCIKLSCGPPPVRNNVVYDIPGGDEGGTFEAIATLSCDDGYYGFGVDISQRCQEDGTWTEADFECIVVTCAIFPSIHNGISLGSGNEYGNEVNIECDSGYYLVGKSTVRCGADGNWDYENEPYCEEAGCLALPEPSNGLSQVSGSGVGAVVTYSCNDGFRLQGSGRRVCEQGGIWSGSDPYCRLIICEVPPYVEHTRPFDSLTQYLYNSKARYTCDVGYELSAGDSTLICSNKGGWSGIVPTCSLVQCQEPIPVSNSKIHITTYSYQSEAQYICSLGYRLKGLSTVQCDEHGDWVGILPICVPIDCREPPEVSNSVILGSGSHTFNSEVQYVCEVGFRLVGQKTSSCLATGVWSGQPPLCEPITCGPPQDIQNANYTGNDHYYRSVVTYTCFRGFKLTGNPTLECTYDGSWIGVRPECLPETCGPPPVFPRSSTTMPMGAIVGSVVSFLCNDGFYLIGSAAAKCTDSKQWEYEGVPPECRPKDCKAPPELINGVGSFTDTTYDSDVSYRCHPGFTLRGHGSVRCGSNGEWEGGQFTCELVNCGAHPSGDHMIVTGNSSTYQSMVEYSCVNGYKLLEESTSVCTETGDWSVQFPQCLRVTCKQLYIPENGITIHGDLQHISYYQDRLELDCSHGYKLIGNRLLECLETGRWSSDLPLCQASDSKVCVEDTGVEHSRDMNEEFPVGWVEAIRCEAGYKATGDMTTTCLEDHTWSSPDGTCSRGFCGKPRLRDFVNVVRISGASYVYGDKITFRCRAGVSPARSPPVITCLDDGTWDGVIACGVTCKRPCQHGGICLGLNRCKCPNGYGGPVCEHAICILPCLNGGKCSSPYQCTCPSGYGGVRCQRPVCSKPCAHGGKCIRPNRCYCRFKYSGPFCENKNF